MSTEESRHTPEEMDEAMRRVFADGAKGLQSDEDIQESMDAGVEAGWLEVIDEPDGRLYKLTAAGNEKARGIIDQALLEPPPRHDAETHLYLVLQEMADEDEALVTAFELGKHILQVEHFRLADRIEQFSDEWAHDLADLIRRGAL